MANIKPRTKDDEIDPWDLMGDPGAYGLPDPGSYGPPPEWGQGYPSGPPSDGTVGPGDPGMNPDTGGSGGFKLPSWLTSLLGPLLGGAAGGAGGAGGLGSLVPLLALLGGGINSSHATSQARDDMLQANRDARDTIQGRMGAMTTAMQPYSDIGREAEWNLNAMGPSALQPNYRPLGSGKGLAPLSQLTKGAR